jgi:outer membrane murein-binding lipoprotein Lpp
LIRSVTFTKVEKLKQGNVNLARGQLAHREVDEVRQLNKKTDELKTVANQTNLQLKAADEKFGKAKEAVTTQIMELRADVKEKDQLLKETQDLVKAAGQGSEGVQAVMWRSG